MKYALAYHAVKFAHGNAGFLVFIPSLGFDRKPGSLDMSAELGPVGVVPSPVLKRLSMTLGRLSPFGHEKIALQRKGLVQEDVTTPRIDVQEPDRGGESLRLSFEGE
jgi:hypothetical protein